MKGFLSVFEENWAASRVSRDLLLPGGSSSQCEAQRLEVQRNTEQLRRKLAARTSDWLKGGTFPAAALECGAVMTLLLGPLYKLFSRGSEASFSSDPAGPHFSLFPRSHDSSHGPWESCRVLVSLLGYV